MVVLGGDRVRSKFKKNDKMPSKLINGYKFQFYSGDRGEPPHIHVVKAEKRAKIWLNSLRIEWSRHFSPGEINRILNILEEHQQELVEWYNEFFTRDQNS